MVGGIDRNIFAARNAEAQLFFSTFLQEILVQAMAELAGVVPYYIVFAGMISRAPSKDVNTDLMLADLGGLSGNLALTYVEQKAREQNRFRKAPAGDDALSQLPAWLRAKIKNRFPCGRGRQIGAGCAVFRVASKSGCETLLWFIASTHGRVTDLKRTDDKRLLSGCLPMKVDLKSTDFFSADPHSGRLNWTGCHTLVKVSV